MVTLIPPNEFDSMAMDRPLYVQIYQYYRDVLVKGQIPLHERLPSIRRLSQHLSISRNPVEAAYSQLIAEGYLIGKPKSGYYPAALEWQFPTDLKTSLPLPQAESSPLPEKKPLIAFDYDRTDVTAFPLAGWRRVTHKSLQGSASDLLHYGDRQGEPGLREQIAIHIRQQRGIRCEAEQIIVTSGTQHAVILLSGLLANEAPERKPLRIGVEAAMHPGLLHVLRHQRLEVVPIELEADGLSLSGLEAAPSMQAVYVTPSHQFPYGMVMPAAKRLQLLSWAHKKQVFLIEDDYDHDFLYEGRPIPALQGLDIHGSVVYLGTFSKALAPGIRLGYIVLPPRLLTRFKHELPHYDQTASRLTQKAMELFMVQGIFDRLSAECGNATRSSATFYTKKSLGI